MLNKKRVISLILTGVLSTGMMVGCSTTDQAVNDAKQKVEQQSSQSDVMKHKDEVGNMITEYGTFLEKNPSMDDLKAKSAKYRKELYKYFEIYGNIKNRNEKEDAFYKLLDAFDSVLAAGEAGNTEYISGAGLKNLKEATYNLLNVLGTDTTSNNSVQQQKESKQTNTNKSNSNSANEVTEGKKDTTNTHKKTNTNKKHESTNSGNNNTNNNSHNNKEPQWEDEKGYYVTCPDCGRKIWTVNGDWDCDCHSENNSNDSSNNDNAACTICGGDLYWENGAWHCQCGAKH